MWMTNLYKGIIMGLITGMPLGPIGAICLKTTLTKGSKFGIIAGLGSAIADSLFALIAAIGSSAVIMFVFNNKLYFHFFGGIILIILGINMYFSKQHNEAKDMNKVVIDNSLFKPFISTFFIALTNPATILTFLVIFTSSQFSNLSKSYNAKILLVLGVFIGSMIWWIILIIATGRLKEKMNLQKMKIVNVVISLIITASGLYMLLSISNYHQYIAPAYLHAKLLELFLNLKGVFFSLP